MPRSYDLLVIGSGAGATTAAFTCAEAGWRVAVVDDRPLGGTCALRGCDPKKVLVGAAELHRRAARLAGHGLAAAPTIRWADLMAFKRTFTDPVPENKERSFREAGIETFRATARFVDAHTVAIGQDEVRVERVLIAAGAEPTALPIPGSEHLVTSDDFLDLDALPPRLAFVGGGYISMEFAHVACAAGAAVTVLHRGARILDGFEPALTTRLAQHSRASGVDVRVETAVKAVERTGGDFVVVAKTASGEGLRVEADMVVHGAGRTPKLEALNLEEAGVRSGRGGVEVNEYLQSVSAEHVYAAGDSADSGGLPLTPVAGRESEIAAENMLHGNRRAVDYGGTPTVAFTIPPLASVGLTEDEARQRGLDIEVKEGDMSGWYSYRRIREETACFKTIVERGTGRLVGAHLLGEGAPELINLFGLAIRGELPARALREMIYAYPTHSSDVPYLL
jgi:glutathione reductase (NADPH)